MKLNTASILLLSIPALSHASSTYECPLPNSPNYTPVQASNSGVLSLSSRIPSSFPGPAKDYLCLLSLLVPSPNKDGSNIRKPVARSYGGRHWEVKAGLYSEFLRAPSCDEGDGVCTFSNLPVAGAGEKYILTSYEYGGDERVEAARFLEQSTFGASLAEIDDLASTVTSASSSPDFATWISDQMSPKIKTSHRAYFRQHTNPRAEYPYYGAGPAPTTPCSITGRWRTFALSERDGIVAMKTNQNKMLHIDFDNNSKRFIWYIDGFARTSTASLGYMRDVHGKNVRKIQPGVAYTMNCGRYDNDNSKYSCVGCPVRICRQHDNKCDYIQNPAMDARGIENTNRMRYNVIDLPAVNANDGSTDMVGIDDAVEFQVMTYKKTGDEFWLNATINQNQCEGMPDPQRPQETRFNEGRFNMLPYQRMESALPTMMGRAFDHNSGKTITLAFDPILQFRENTIDNPIADGGGANNLRMTDWWDGLGWTNPRNGRFDQPVNDGAVHCANARRTFLNEDGCKLSFAPTACTQPDKGSDSVAPDFGNGQGVVVCGSPEETANDFTNGVVDGFDQRSAAESGAYREIYKEGPQTQQKYNAWFHIALRAKDQLRQRVAWTLYQILPVAAKGGHDGYTEVWMVYYDIYVRHAFGSYFDVLKEVSFTGIMANWLSYRNNASIQYALNKGQEIYPDENYAREIMQLFSIGLFKLNMDGTRQLDSTGNFIYTYDSDVIMSYARAWTGLKYQNYKRGNLESEGHDQKLDPIVIDREKRDVFPKSDLLGGFIGDGLPLCTDLPPRMHLRKGATYLVLGSKSNPEQQWEEPNWEGSSSKTRLELDTSSSPLRDILCAPGSDGVCTYPGKVTLEDNLVYGIALENLAEHSSVNEVRTVRVTGGPVPVYYEYIRAPCVHKNFFDGAKKVIGELISGNGVVNDSMCADNSGITAATSCCEVGSTAGIHVCNYAGERMTFASAMATCMANGYALCDPHSWAGGNICTDQQTYSWSSAGCQVRAKISFETYQVARVDYPDADSAGQRKVKNLVRDDTVNYFSVLWADRGSLPSDAASCDDLESCYSVDDGCVCDTFTRDSAVFTTVVNLSKASILKNLRIGSVDPTTYGVGVYTSIGECVTGVEVYSKTASNCGDPLDKDTIFKVTDANGIERTFINKISTVSVASTAASFRNPVHFIDYMNRNLRDMQQETDAVLNSYFHHSSHAPFLALRFLQRFGISNPSPAYVERVATAYKLGSYNGQFGTGEYGDLGAMIAAVLLDDESRQVVLDADQSHGHLREPIVKIFGLMKAMEAGKWAPLSVPLFYMNIQQVIGQGPYRTPSVFSFFKPEFNTGALQEVGLVAPEAEVLKGDWVLQLLNGIWSMSKFGLSWCHGGFQQAGWGVACNKNEGQQMIDAGGTLQYEAHSSASLDDVLSELALMLTAGRLSDSNRVIVRNAMKSTFNSGNLAKAVRIAVQLIASSPEFSSTNVARNTGTPTPLSGYTSRPSKPYKAIIYYFMAGGADSYNLLVPTADCRDGRDVYKEYKSARGKLALGTSQLLTIDASGSNQVCDKFAVNSAYANIQKMYTEGDALFVANAGVLNKPLTKHDDYKKESKVQLFAHNHMSVENFRCDINNDAAGTGVGGRILDMLGRQGYHTSANTVDGGTKFIQGSAVDNNPVWSVPYRDPEEIDRYSTVGPNMLNLVKSLNGIGAEDDGFLANTWSIQTSRALFEYEKSLEYAELFDSEEFDMSHYSKSGSGLHNRFRSMAQYIKMRDVRKVNREVFYIQHDGLDSHSETKEQVNDMFASSDKAIKTFIDEMKLQELWDNVVIIMGSDFGRSITPNSSGGTDHGWGGNYFVLGGSVKGRQIIGEYPDYLSKRSDTWMSRGRVIPTTPWDSVWHGVAQWMGVFDNDLAAVLPNMYNFRKCDMYTDSDLFEDGVVPPYECNSEPTETPTTTTPTETPTDSPTSSPTHQGPTNTPTPLPTGTPSVSMQPSLTPTTASPASMTLPLEDIGNNGSPPELFPLRKCQGDCDNDGECEDGLYCLQRGNFEPVPGCEGGDFDKKTDFCFQRPANYLWDTGKEGLPDSAYPLNACDGDCDADDECIGDFVCLARVLDEAVPGCEGSGRSASNYCYDPNPRQPTTPGPTHTPTNTPTPNPTTAVPTSSLTTTPPTSNPTDAPTPSPTTAVPTASPTTASPTSNPTDAPTPSPTTAVPTTSPITASPITAPPTPATSTLPFKRVGNSGSNYGQCEGDCDRGKDCLGDLFCFQRGNFEPVPGCEGGDFDKDTDFCFQRPSNYLWKVGNNGSPSTAFPLNACDGDCDRDSDCAGDFECFQSNSNIGTIVGCIGKKQEDTDYCYDPTLP